jgi:hypothetical protein
MKVLNNLKRANVVRNYFLLFAASSFSAFSSDDVLKDVNSKVEHVLQSAKKSSNYSVLTSFMVNDAYKERLKYLTNNFGYIDSYSCFNTHSSELFFSLVCHVTYQNHKSGNSWMFYIFKDSDKFVGTRLELSDMLAGKNECIAFKKPKTGVTQDFRFKVVDCSGN